MRGQHQLLQASVAAVQADGADGRGGCGGDGGAGVRQALQHGDEHGVHQPPTRRIPPPERARKGANALQQRPRQQCILRQSLGKLHNTDSAPTHEIKHLQKASFLDGDPEAAKWKCQGSPGVSGWLLRGP